MDPQSTIPNNEEIVHTVTDALVSEKSWAIAMLSIPSAAKYPEIWWEDVDSIDG